MRNVRSALRAVGTAAFAMIEEVRHQFRTIPGLQNAEFAIRSIGILTQGSHKFFGKKTGLRSSGVRGPDGLTTAPYDLKFTKLSPKKGFRYACAVHGAMMSGRVIVG